MGLARGGSWLLDKEVRRIVAVETRGEGVEPAVRNGKVVFIKVALIVCEVGRPKASVSWARGGKVGPTLTGQRKRPSIDALVTADVDNKRRRALVRTGGSSGRGDRLACGDV